MLVGNITVNDGSSGNIEYYTEAPYGATLNISMLSLDNHDVVEDATKLYQYAVDDEKWGDALFFQNFIYYNGQNYNYTDFPDFLLDLYKIANGNFTLYSIWSNTSTDPTLAEFYLRAKDFVPNIVYNTFIISDSSSAI
ncbi:uncharacterized protein SCODWIG_03137 [Saccharomycodes ludwigii]|uniref:WD-like domain-containing protein n=2 Tax=Saccharomycodes ludwigii TaxID=36035 RepID=A0A376B9M7_9ASCO|nr:uncharacterized protein SCODWIG_03137 [Saccharomycodes ludwigii]